MADEKDWPKCTVEISCYFQHDLVRLILIGSGASFFLSSDGLGKV